ncbi:MAG: hypothetical protein MUE63_13745 [Xanthomonadales bacterium]|nr:hypothetical protein [Xanthomonadales bacterium]
MSHGASPLAAFHRVGDRSRLPAPAATETLRPALFAAYHDLSRLRSDFPVVLTGKPGAGPWAVSLADVVDGLLRQVTQPGAADEEVRRHLLAVEGAVRRSVQSGQVPSQRASLALLWEAARRELAAGGAPVPERAPTVPGLDGELLACGRDTAARLVQRAWRESEGHKGRRLFQRVERLAQKLSDILQADHMRSPAARGPEQLANAVGGSDRAVFDFQAMAKLLQAGGRAEPLPARRRQRIQSAIDTLRSQRFATAEGLPAGANRLDFAFQDCAAALAAFRARLPDMRALVEAIGIAELEIENHYDEARHDRFFEQLTAERLGPGDFELFPSYLVCIEELDAGHRAAACELLESGLPFKIVAQSADILGDLTPIGGQLSFGKRGQHLARMALGLNDVFVLQAPNAFLYRLRDRVLQAVSVPQAALISVYAGPDYLASAAACEARAFPCFVYDPGAGKAADNGLAARFSLDGNPQREQDWPRYRLGYELNGHDRQDVDTAFTLVDFVAADPRFASCFASVTAPEEPGDAENRLVAVDEYLRLGARERSRALPCVLLIDEQNRVRRAVVDEKLLLAQADARTAAPAPATAPVATAAPAAAVPAPAAPPEAAEPAPSSDDPWIETARCTTCNECTQLNDRMFGYNENKQAPRPARWPSFTPASRATPTSRGWRNCSSAQSRFFDGGCWRALWERTRNGTPPALLCLRQNRTGSIACACARRVHQSPARGLLQ